MLIKILLNANVTYLVICNNFIQSNKKIIYHYNILQKITKHNIIVSKIIFIKLIYLGKKAFTNFSSYQKENEQL